MGRGSLAGIPKLYNRPALWWRTGRYVSTCNLRVLTIHFCENVFCNFLNFIFPSYTNLSRKSAFITRPRWGKSLFGS